MGVELDIDVRIKNKETLDKLNKSVDDFNLKGSALIKKVKEINFALRKFSETTKKTLENKKVVNQFNKNISTIRNSLSALQRSISHELNPRIKTLSSNLNKIKSVLGGIKLSSNIVDRFKAINTASVNMSKSIASANTNLRSFLTASKKLSELKKQFQAIARSVNAFNKGAIKFNNFMVAFVSIVKQLSDPLTTVNPLIGRLLLRLKSFNMLRGVSKPLSSIANAMSKFANSLKEVPLAKFRYVAVYFKDMASALSRLDSSTITELNRVLQSFRKLQGVHTSINRLNRGLHGLSIVFTRVETRGNLLNKVLDIIISHLEKIDRLGLKVTQVFFEMGRAINEMTQPFREFNKNIRDANNFFEKKGAKKYANDLKEIERATRKANSSSKGFVSSLRTIWGGFNALSGLINVAGNNIANFFAQADRLTRMESQLKAVGLEGEKFVEAQEKVRLIATNTRSDLEETNKLFAKMVGASKSLRLNMDGTAVSTELLLKTLQISGATTAGASAFILQFGQALGTGRATGEELNTILEQNVFFGKLLANSFGVSVGELKKLASEGKITSEVLKNTLLNNIEKIRTSYSNLPVRLDQAWQVLKNGINSVVGRIAQFILNTTSLQDSLIKSGEYLLDLSTKSKEELFKAIFGANFELDVFKSTLLDIWDTTKTLLKAFHFIAKAIALIIKLVVATSRAVTSASLLIVASVSGIIASIIETIEAVIIGIPVVAVQLVISFVKVIFNFLESVYDGIFSKVQILILNIKNVWIRFTDGFIRNWNRLAKGTVLEIKTSVDSEKQLKKNEEQIKKLNEQRNKWDNYDLSKDIKEQLDALKSADIFSNKPFNFLSDPLFGISKQSFKKSQELGLKAGNSLGKIISDFNTGITNFFKENKKSTDKNTEGVNKNTDFLRKTDTASLHSPAIAKTNVFEQMLENIEEFLNDPKAFDDIGKQFNITLKNSIADALKTGNFKDIGKAVLDKFTSDVIDTFVNKVFEGDKKGDTINLFGALVDLVGGIFGGETGGTGGAIGPSPDRPNPNLNVHPIYGEIVPSPTHPVHTPQSLTQNINITGDVTTQTRSIVMGMMPEIADSTQRIFNQRRILRS